MTIADLPAVNATLNGIAAVFLIIGWLFIKGGNIRAHATCMISAFLVSAVFLACYLTYHAYAGSKPFPGTGVWRPIYFYILLIPHIVLAVVMLPMILTVFYRAYRRDWERHKRLARITLPIWVYVSITGVLVYVMLYRVAW